MGKARFSGFVSNGRVKGKAAETAANSQVVRKNRPTQAKPPAPPLQVHCLLWWDRRFRLPMPPAADFFSRPQLSHTKA
jgi:hypothetical protein